MKAIYRYILLSAVILISIFLLSGCWDERKLDELGIPFIVGYDYASEEEKEYPEDKYLVSVGSPIFYEDVESKYNVDSTPGKSVTDTRDRRNSCFGEHITFGQTQILVFGEELAGHEDLFEVTDSMSRNPRVKASIHMAVVSGRAVDLLEMRVAQYPDPSIYIRMLLKNLNKSNFFPFCTVFMFNRHVISDFTAPILPYIIQKEGDIVAAGACFIDGGKGIKKIGRRETEIAVLLRGMESRGIISYDVKKNNKVIDQVSFSGSNKRKVKIRREGDKYIADISIKLFGKIIEHKKNEPIIGSKDMLELSETSLEDNIKKRAEDFVRKVQEEYGFDALDLARKIKGHTREKLKKGDIDRIIREAEINVDVEVNIENTGGKM